MRQFIELAVNMPAQEPQPGQAETSPGRATAAPLMRPALNAAHALEDVDQVDGPPVRQPSRAHRAAADEDRRDVEAHRRHQHAGDDLVAVGDADHRVEAVGGDHRLDAVGDELAAGQGVLHAEVAHDDAVVDGDGVELEGYAAGRAHASLTIRPTSCRWTWPGTMSV